MGLENRPEQPVPRSENQAQLPPWVKLSQYDPFYTPEHWEHWLIEDGDPGISPEEAKRRAANIPQEWWTSRIVSMRIERRIRKRLQNKQSLEAHLKGTGVYLDAEIEEAKRHHPEWEWDE